MAGKISAGGQKIPNSRRNNNQFKAATGRDVPNVPTPNIHKAMSGGTIRGKK